MENGTNKRDIRAVAERGVKVAISMLWYSGDELSRALMRLAGRRPAARFVVLYYHEVPEEARARFARQMQALSRGTTVVRAAHAGPLPDEGSYVAITFDDAFQSVRRNAVPELLSRRFPATIFVPVDYLGKKPRLGDDGRSRRPGNDLRRVAVASRAYRPWITQPQPSPPHEDRRGAAPRRGHRVTPQAGGVARQRRVAAGVSVRGI